MEFKTPYFAIIGILAAILWILDMFKVFKKPEIFLSSDNKSKFNFMNLFRYILIISGMISWLCISYSLMTPRKAQIFAPASKEMNDVFIVVDVSRSMLANDFYPNRLEAAKQKIREFIKLNPSDRIGIIIFSEKAFTLLPLTRDLNLIKKMISRINTGRLGPGTNIGDAVGLAVARSMGSEALNQTIILLTDGVSMVGALSPIQAAEDAKKNNIKIHTIGIGSTKKEVRIPLNNGRRKIFQRIPGGSVDLKTLNKMSSITGGTSYTAYDSKALTKVLKKISDLEKKKIKINSQIIYKELYFEFFMYGLFGLLFVELFKRLLLKEII